MDYNIFTIVDTNYSFFRNGCVWSASCECRRDWSICIYRKMMVVVSEGRDQLYVRAVKIVRIFSTEWYYRSRTRLYIFLVLSCFSNE